ncbi:hypothetical protein COW99_04665 [Candidatus Roizmanbacteria bacterium CG22_combo_CG10-13_8_21_14_all_38_20]|uniref:DUF3105 domain-containing protein n=1 Tax=Candidatus Roizmanbacteria bacterium CG22_combo_CG10-13_8_21_14_all_38_20 TaxID=1974862 RepID=A0A2H0BUB1_9BACT|nr:DUF3105 domain-containing protein [Candidatus Microgenomates bacterium]PIP61277.1 MAG: hypothetical protein COW99_04665 [Candidatus Roizmanbacteria bacterium CG22_combo_CG10-13_8_21_14_all_38_20]PJC31071.1 MAG: hypothetical protein CO050_04390 [Candidatus Roizmanbacteria bacterium CG_4_9_14_0_2_um_filter_38_17]
MNIDYPKEWNELTKKERRIKIKELEQQKKLSSKRNKKIRNFLVITLIVGALLTAYIYSKRQTPQEVALKQEIDSVSLEGKVEDFSIEGRSHVSSGTDVSYKTNPPTSGDHLAQAENWGTYSKEIDDKAGVHGLEHGGVWISYKDISKEDIKVLEGIGKENSLSVIVSPRSANDVPIAVVSWGRMMKLESVDKAVIQKYIDTYKNDSPEKLAR